MPPVVGFVNSQKSQGAKAHIASSSGGPNINRHNLSALDREAAETKRMGLLPSFLPECQWMPGPPPPPLHAPCRRWHRCCKQRAGPTLARHRQLLAATPDHAQSGKKETRKQTFSAGLNFKPEGRKQKGLD